MRRARPSVQLLTGSAHPPAPCPYTAVINDGCVRCAANIKHMMRQRGNVKRGRGCSAGRSPGLSAGMLNGE